ncbi:MAG: KilA-N domain-containing protein [Elusimicrobiota bacterium]|jgi:hypothetical protein|nr:KilA-N domain-containing protein [Elusimicrobiota bacterium]
MAVIKIESDEIAVITIQNEDYISLTDMMKAKDGDFFITDWLRNRNTLEYLGIWEEINNPAFNYGEFAAIKSNAGLNSFKTSVKELIEKSNIVGLCAKAGRYGGTYAHKDIAFHFGMWISPRFQLLLIREFQRLKENEQKQLGWSAKQELSKINYHIHTDAIERNLVPKELTAKQASFVYADEADVLNVALFGITAKQWREQNPKEKGNIRDYASINQLICLSNMETINAVMIDEGLSQSERLVKLNAIAIQQMSVLQGISQRKLLK